MKRLTTNQMLKVEGGCAYCMSVTGAVPQPPAGRLIAYVLHVLFH